VTLGTLEIIAAHVHIALSAWPIQHLAHVTVLDRVATAAAEVTIAARLTAGSANMVGHVQQINLRSRHACTGWVLFVAAGGVVAHETVNPRLISEIE
jgi:hypothetical protein